MNMAVTASLPQIGTIIFTAAIDSINPCAIGVLILLISAVIARGDTGKTLLKRGLVYIAAVFVTYLVAGLGLMYVFTNIPIYIAEYISIFVGTVIVFAGLVEVKDFFWYGKGFSLTIPPAMAKKLDVYTKNLTTPGLAFLGAFVAGVELPCTGAPYLAIIMVLSQNFNLTAFLLLVLYNIIFVLPLVIILLLAYGGTKVQELKMWKQEARPYMRLMSGLLMIGLGWLLILIANGTINFG